MRKSTILLIDEDVHFLQTVARRLEKLGYHVKPARCPEEARRAALQLRPSVILIDRGLPGDGEAGRRILAALRADPATAQIPVLMTSARQQLLS
jgi:DNA-binding response OmpR family regulator